ncbi:MAG: hypothetical protein M3403_01230, partial [Gemmatimonadota bacterium]|nr:hypothetical protein [Gemmatimonadota bacterium]
MTTSIAGGVPVQEFRNSEIDRRAQLHDRRRQGIRRRTNRLAARFCILFAADLLALASARLVLGWAVARSQD